MSQRGSWKKKLAALGVSLVLSFGAAEVIVRLFVGAPLAERLPILSMRANEYRGWQMVPDQLHYTYEHPVQVNSLGLRGPQVKPRVPGEVRVLALGDSLIYGQGVADDQTLPAHLEVALNRGDGSKRPWTVVNAGHRAYDTHQEIRLLEELGEEIDPDIVILFWFWNDFHERNIERTYRRLSQRGEVTFDTGRKVEGKNWWYWHTRQLFRKSALLMLVHDVRSRAASQDFTDKEIESGMRRLQGYLGRFLELSREQGFDPVLALVPDPNSVLGPHQSLEMELDVTALSKSLGIPVVRLHAAVESYLEESGDLPVLPFDGHYDGNGNRVMASQTATELLMLGLPND